MSGKSGGGGGSAVAVVVLAALALGGGHHGHAGHITGSGSGNVAIGRQMAARRGWTGGQWYCLDALWNRESGWRATVWNYQGSGAYGIPQALPASKMAAAGSDYMTNPATQIRWGLGYIAGRYGTPCGAWSHEQSAGWYEEAPMLTELTVIATAATAVVAGTGVYMLRHRTVVQWSDEATARAGWQPAARPSRKRLTDVQVNAMVARARADIAGILSDALDDEAGLQEIGAAGAVIPAGEVTGDAA